MNEILTLNLMLKLWSDREVCCAARMFHGRLIRFRRSERAIRVLENCPMILFLLINTTD